MASTDTETLFEYIMYNDSEDLADALVNLYDDPNTTNTAGWSLLHIACQFGQLACVIILLDDSRTNVNILGPNRITPIFTVIEYNRPSILKLLLDHPKINVNIFNADMITPLHYALQMNNIECMRLLLQHPKIMTDATDKDGKTVYDIARNIKSNKKKDILNILGIEEDNSEDDSIDDSIDDNDTSEEDEEEDKKDTTIVPVDPNLPENHRDGIGWTPLHNAARDGHVDELKRLLAIPGIDVNVQATCEYYNGYTPLHYSSD